MVEHQLLESDLELFNTKVMRDNIDKMLIEDAKQNSFTLNIVQNTVLPFDMSHRRQDMMSPEEAKRKKLYDKILPRMFGVDEIIIYDFTYSPYCEEPYVKRLDGYKIYEYTGVSSIIRGIQGRGNTEKFDDVSFISCYKVRFKYKNRKLALYVPVQYTEITGTYTISDAKVFYKKYIRDDAKMFDYMFNEIQKTVRDIDSGEWDSKILNELLEQ